MKEFFSRNLKLAKIAGVTFAIFVLLFIRCYDTNDLFRFPFNSNVWGTAADWIMIVVTFFTAILLVRTFNEQKRSNDIQVEKHLKNIIPKFEIKQSDKDPTLGKPSPLNNVYFIVLKLKSNDVRDLEFQLVNSQIIHNLFPSPYEEVGKEFTFELSSKIKSELDDIKKPILTLKFKDIEGNSYIQNAFIKNNKVYLENAKTNVY